MIELLYTTIYIQLILLLLSVLIKYYLDIQWQKIRFFIIILCFIFILYSLSLLFGLFISEVEGLGHHSFKYFNFYHDSFNMLLIIQGILFLVHLFNLLNTLSYFIYDSNGTQRWEITYDGYSFNIWNNHSNFIPVDICVN